MFTHDLRPLIRAAIPSFAFLIYIGVVGQLFPLPRCWLPQPDPFDMHCVFHYRNTAFQSNAVLGICPESCHSLFHSFCYIERLYHDGHRSSTAPLEDTRYVSLHEERLELNPVLYVGRKEARASLYTNILAVFMESSALYAIWSLVFINLYAVNNPGQDILLMTLTNVQVR